MQAARFVAECFWPGTTEDTARVAMGKVRASCEKLAASGVPVRWLGGTFLVGDEALSLRFEGTAQAVRAAHELAGVPIDRLLPPSRSSPMTDPLAGQTFITKLMN